MSESDKKPTSKEYGSAIAVCIESIDRLNESMQLLSYSYVQRIKASQCIWITWSFAGWLTLVLVLYRHTFAHGVFVSLFITLIVVCMAIMLYFLRSYLLARLVIVKVRKERVPVIETFKKHQAVLQRGGTYSQMRLHNITTYLATLDEQITRLNQLKADVELSLKDLG